MPYIGILYADFYPFQDKSVSQVEIFFAFVSVIVTTY